jgi:hypothetical protein
MKANPGAITTCKETHHIALPTSGSKRRLAIICNDCLETEVTRRFTERLTPQLCQDGLAVLQMHNEGFLPSSLEEADVPRWFLEEPRRVQSFYEWTQSRMIELFEAISKDGSVREIIIYGYNLSNLPIVGFIRTYCEHRRGLEKHFRHKWYRRVLLKARFHLILVGGEHFESLLPEGMTVTEYGEQIKAGLEPHWHDQVARELCLDPVNDFGHKQWMRAHVLMGEPQDFGNLMWMLPALITRANCLNMFKTIELEGEQIVEGAERFRCLRNDVS